jgi:hypothetical protein
MAQIAPMADGEDGQQNGKVVPAGDDARLRAGHVKSLLQRGQVHREDGVDHKRLVEGASVQ